jgi:hypothetical protein
MSFSENNFGESEKNEVSNRIVAKDNEDKLPMTCMLGNVLQTQAN